jgi:hypothetical protein
MYEIVCLCGRIVLLEEMVFEGYRGKCSCGREWNLREISGRVSFDEPEPEELVYEA